MQNNIVERRSVKLTVINSIFAVLGAALLACTIAIEDKGTALFLSIMVIGCALLLWGIAKLCTGCNELIFIPTGSPVNEYSFYFQAVDKHKVEKYIADNDIEKLSSIKSDTDGVKLDMKLSKDLKFGSLQMYEYVPHSYEPYGDVVIYDQNTAPELVKLMLKAE